MKCYKILLLMVEIFAILWIISICMPTQGVEFAGSRFEFTSLSEMEAKNSGSSKAADDEHYADQIRAAVLQQQMNEQQKARFQALHTQGAITFPNDSIEWIFPLFDQLIAADKRQVRIMHYGDSQIEVDHITNELRYRLQCYFGGYGVGLLPAVQTVPTGSIAQTCSAQLERYLCFGPETMRSSSRRYGPMGQCAHLQGSATFTFRKLNLGNTKKTTKKFGQITVLLDDLASDLYATASTGTKTVEAKASVGDKFLLIDLPDSTENLTLTLTGNALIYGFLVDGNGKGLQVDNAAMRGCSGTVFVRIDDKSIRPYFKKFNVPLIIMQYGGNSVPYIKSGKAISSYCKNLKAQIDYIHRVAPKSKILFVGPSDMSTNVGGAMQTYPHLPQMVDSLKQMCLANDVAYWDLYASMGGQNSMISWVKCNPPLAGADYVHFTNKGADRAAQLLYNGMASAFNYYLRVYPEINRPEMPLIESK